MDEEVLYVEGVGSSPCYIESLINSWTRLPTGHSLEKKLEDVIVAELELALLAAEKAKSEILKKGKDNIKPIGGGAA